MSIAPGASGLPSLLEALIAGLNRLGDPRYHDEAQKQPITLTKHGRPSVVVPIELFERMTGMEDPRSVYKTSKTPPELANMILAELDRQTAEVEPQQ
ncbi:type II toxin-antitoxin system prevent-host-death family antitoxin [Rhizobium sp. 2YAF20]|uniref:type II toxin-antitoxin system prevent-host-death family antitoxin n=1 Tax=Rhizobium sp. 2YAF20 TaxID=3233027 RepID=UPI003F9813A1